MLKVENLHCKFDKEVLHNVSFDLKQGEIIGIVGKSGGGKTSLLRIIGGFLTASRGDVHLNGKRLPLAKELLVPGYENIALVQQDFGLDLYHTVKENIREKILHLPVKHQDVLIREMFDLLDLSKLSEQQAILLSGGEQQRLSIARALVSESDLVLMDEPFVHLDAPMKRRLIGYLEKLNELRSTSFIIVTHNGEEILGLCDKVIYIKKGKIKRQGKPNRFYDYPRSIEEAEFFGPVNVVQLGQKRILFRPDQYSLVDSEKNKLNIKYKKSRKQGPLFHNEFISKRGEEILLFSFNSMETVNCIYV